MKKHFRWLAAFLILIGLSVSSMPVLAGPRLQPSLQEETSTPGLDTPSPAEIIEAVNNLRLQHGLNVLMVSDILMESLPARQTHWRPARARSGMSVPAA